MVHAASTGDMGVGGWTVVGVATARVTKVKRARVVKDFISDDRRIGDRDWRGIWRELFWALEVFSNNFPDFMRCPTSGGANMSVWRASSGFYSGSNEKVKFS